jgi:hypothetical protein
LDETIQNIGAETVSAFLAETVSGGSLAAYPPPDEYFSIIRKICDRYDVLLIMDEVMCGMGRTGRWFACQHYDVIPDIITLGKGLSGGTLALSAVGVRSTHFETIRHGSGTFVHGGTFSHNPVAAAAGLAAIHILEREGLVERASQYGEQLGNKLKKRLKHLSCVSDIRGIGLMWGVELVADKDTNTPFPRHEKVVERIWNTLFEKGIITYKSTGLAGMDGDALIIAPPFVIKKDEIDFLVDTVASTLKETLG